MAAGFWGGLAGGALTGGLEGGWQGALMGAAMGGALGAIGGWGVTNYGAGFGVGMLAAGAGVAGVTNSWDSFAGGITGGIFGGAVGNGMDSSFHDGISLQNPTAGPAAGKGPEENPNWIMRGIGTTDEEALDTACRNQATVFYIRTRGIGSDLVRAGMQKVFGNSLASRQFSAYLRNATGGSIWAHSEGTLTLAGAIKALRVEGVKISGLRLSFNGPAIARSTAANLAKSIGAEFAYHLNWSDPIGFFTTINPAEQIIYGAVGIATLAHSHSASAYGH